MRILFLTLFLAGCGGGDDEPYASCWAAHGRVCEQAVACATYSATDPECKAIK